jgi:hypothetical protein
MKRRTRRGDKLAESLLSLVRRFAIVYRDVVRRAEGPQGAGLVGIRKAFERLDARVGGLIVAPGVDAELRLRLQEAGKVPGTQAERNPSPLSRDDRQRRLRKRFTTAPSPQNRFRRNSVPDGAHDAARTGVQWAPVFESSCQQGDSPG